jgi:hypothetical protein
MELHTTTVASLLPLRSNFIETELLRAELEKNARFTDVTRTLEYKCTLHSDDEAEARVPRRRTCATWTAAAAAPGSWRGCAPRVGTSEWARQNAQKKRECMHHVRCMRGLAAGHREP